MLAVELITPEGIALEAKATSVTLPTMDGEITVLPGHVALISSIAPGTMIVRSNGNEEFFAVARGVIEVTPSSVRVLSDIADRAELLEEAAIEIAKERAERLVHEKRADVEEFAKATALLELELARLKSIRRRGLLRRNVDHAHPTHPSHS